MFSVSDNGYSFLAHYQNRIDIIRCEQNGKRFDRSTLYESDSRINTIKVQSLDNNFAAIQLYGEQSKNGLIWYCNGVTDIYYPTETSMALQAIDSKHIIESSFGENIYNFKIICK